MPCMRITSSSCSFGPKRHVFFLPPVRWIDIRSIYTRTPANIMSSIDINRMKIIKITSTSNRCWRDCSFASRTLGALSLIASSRACAIPLVRTVSSLSIFGVYLHTCSFRIEILVQLGHLLVSRIKRLGLGLSVSLIIFLLAISIQPTDRVRPDQLGVESRSHPITLAPSSVVDIWYTTDHP
jgi:hypothetical protein